MKYASSLGISPLVCITFCFWLSTSFAQEILPSPLCTRIEHDAHEWAATCSSLSPSAVQVLANFLYFSYRYCYYDMQTNKALLELKRTLPTLHLEMRNNVNPLEKTTTYMRACKKFFAYNGLRYHIYLCWQQCTTYLESLPDPLLNNVYEHLRSCGQKIIINYFATNTIPISLTQLKKNLQQISIHFNYIINKIKILFETPLNTPSHDLIFDTETAFQISKDVQAIAEEIHQPLAALDQYEINIIFVAAYVFRTYYCTLYSTIPACNQRIIFGPHGLLPEQHFHALPTPNALLI